MGDKNEPDMLLIDFQIKILTLVDEKREDTFWDFKQEWHQNNAELLHDIICLANADHHGDRYLIFGITDPPECKIAGIQSDPNRKTQTDLLDFLANAGFSGDLRPSVSIKSLVFPEGEVDVIIIKNITQKPLTLSKQYHDGKIYLHSGSIYTRVHDKNTATDSTADLYFVERMWRERFGLDLSPLSRMQNYLLDYEAWKWDGIDTGYYSIFPEFTICICKEEETTNSHHWWSSWPVNEPSRRFYYNLKYHLTTLKKMKVIHFDREDLSIPFPDIDYILLNSTERPDAENTYCFYSYLESSLEFSLLVNLLARYFKHGIPLQIIKEKEALRSPTKPPLGFLPFPIFSCESEKNDFLISIKNNLLVFFQSNPGFPCAELGAKKQAEEKIFSYWAYDHFGKWKEK
jgi:hypothetical protein